MLTIEEVAKVCGVARRTVDRWTAGDRPLKTYTIGQRLLVVLPADLVAFATACGMLLVSDPHAAARPWPRAQAQDGGTAA